jgi:hypothetical protein
MTMTTDICVYGATPSGVCAAVAACRKGAEVTVIEPSRWAGGILSGGILPAQDAPHEAAIGGLSKWVLDNVSGTNAEREEAFRSMLISAGAQVIYEYRLKSVEKNGTVITAATFECAPPDSIGQPVAEASEERPEIRIEAGVFIDATYEGDLMAMAEVDYAIGREPASQYLEMLAGVQPIRDVVPINPYRDPDDPSSGLLPHVEEPAGLEVGSGDEYTQAYNFRYYVTDDERYRIEFTPPDDYDAADFELLGRYVEYMVERGKSGDLWRMFPARKGDGQCNYQRSVLFSIAPVGISRFYQDGDYAERARIWREHIDYLRGLHHFMSTDPRVPESIREKNARIGLDKRQHPNNNGWPTQLYVRVARRMKGRYVLTQADVEHRTDIADPIGYAGYGIDVYPVRRVVIRDDNGVARGVATEGEMFVGGSQGTGPYPIPYRMITPQYEECSNLLVPLCYSASFVAYASSRMEPVYMITGECAGIAATLALDNSTSVQQVDYQSLRTHLLEANQIVPEPEGELDLQDRSAARIEAMVRESGEKVSFDCLGRLQKKGRMSTGISIEDERLKVKSYTPKGLRK